MQKDISLTIEKLHGEQEEECRIASVRQIQSLLRNLSDEGSRAALYCDGANDFIMTVLLDIGDKGLWVEQGADAAKNRRIAESKHITLVSSLNRVKIQFSVSGIRPVTHQGYPAFYLPLPASLYRIQRREYFRLSIPSSEGLRCSIPVNSPQAGGRIELPVLDISGGGMRLSCAEEGIELAHGQTYTGCRIDLPETGRIEVAIRVKNLISVHPKPGQTIQRIGCAFSDIDNASSALLQRYVTRMQRIKNDPQ